MGATFTGSANDLLTFGSVPSGIDTAVTFLGLARPANGSNYYQIFSVVGGASGSFHLETDVSNNWVLYQSDQETALLTVTGAWTLNAWHAFAVIWRGTGTAELHIRPLSTDTITSNTASGYAVGSGASLRIGNGVSFPDNWQGEITGFRIFDRALTTQEIRAEWLRFGWPVAQDAWAAWPFESPDELELDLSANGRTVTVGGSAGHTLGPNPSGTPYGGGGMFVLAAGTGAQTVSPGTVVSGEAVPSPTVAPGAVTAQPTAIASAESVPSPTISQGTTVAPNAIASGEVVEAPTIVPGAIATQPNAIASAESVPSPVVASSGSVSPSAIASGESVPNPTVAVEQPFWAYPSLFLSSLPSRRTGNPLGFSFPAQPSGLTSQSATGHSQLQTLCDADDQDITINYDPRGSGAITLRGANNRLFLNGRTLDTLILSDATGSGDTWHIEGPGQIGQMYTAGGAPVDITIQGVAINSGIIAYGSRPAATVGFNDATRIAFVQCLVNAPAADASIDGTGFYGERNDAIFWIATNMYVEPNFGNSNGWCWRYQAPTDMLVFVGCQTRHGNNAIFRAQDSDTTPGGGDYLAVVNHIGSIESPEAQIARWENTNGPTDDYYFVSCTYYVQATSGTSVGHLMGTDGSLRYWHTDTTWYTGSGHVDSAYLATLESADADYDFRRGTISYNTFTAFPSWRDVDEGSGYFTDSDPSGLPTLAIGATGIVIGADHIGSAESVEAPAVSIGGMTLQPAVISSGEVVEAPTIVPGAIATQPNAISSGESVPSPGIALSALLSSIASGEAVPSPTVAPGAVTTQPTAIASAESVPSPTVLADGAVQPAAIPTGETVPSPTVAPGAVTTQPTVIASAESVPSPTVAPGAVTAQPNAIATGEVIYDPGVLQEGIVSPTAIASGESVLSPQVIADATVAPAAIASGEIVPAPQVNLRLILGSGIPSGESVPAPQVNLRALPSGVASGESVPSPTVQPGGVVTQPDPISTGEAVSAPALALHVLPAGIASGELVSAPSLAMGPVTVLPAGVASGELVHAPVVIGGLETVPSPTGDRLHSTARRAYVRLVS